MALILRSEYDFDYEKAQSNPFATFPLFVRVDDTVLNVLCGRRRTRLLSEALEASNRSYPITDGGTAIRLFGHIYAGEIYHRFVYRVTDSQQVAEGDAAALKELDTNAVIAVTREWINQTGGFESLPGIDPATARRLAEEMEPGVFDAQLRAAAQNDAQDDAA